VAVDAQLPQVSYAPCGVIGAVLFHRRFCCCAFIVRRRREGVPRLDELDELDELDARRDLPGGTGPEAVQ
jgi:hypothetical protein